MKKKFIINLAVILAGFAMTVAAGASGTRTPATTNGVTNPEGKVQSAAHHYIAENANLGGNVSGCSGNLAGDLFTMTCTGEYKAFGAGEGTVKVKFKCVGKFMQGENAVFFQQGKIGCEDE